MNTQILSVTFHYIPLSLVILQESGGSRDHVGLKTNGEGTKKHVRDILKRPNKTLAICISVENLMVPLTGT